MSGLDREVSALFNLTSIRFVDCSSLDDYIGRMLDASKGCKDADVVIEDKIATLLMLGKLSTEYRPLVMGLTAGGEEITVESVKSSLLRVKPKLWLRRRS